MTPAGASPAAVREAPPRENPYVGLVPFGEDDTDWFFGRDREQRIIGANLRSSRLTLLYGASGVGKSSVLLAAVVPALRAVVAEERAARESADPDNRRPVRFAVAVFGSWRDAPLDGLKAAVAASVEEATGEPVAPWTPETPLREAFASWLGPVRNLLVVLDQFEEYFLYHPHEDGPGTFAGELVDVVNDPDLRVNFLISLREDGLAKLDRFKGRIPGLFDNYLRVGHLDLEAARRAIEGPRDEYNRRLPADSEPATIDEQVIDALLAEVATQKSELEGPGAPAPEADQVAAPAIATVETPLLQLVMQRLWTAAVGTDGAPPHVSLATLREKLGGTQEIVLRHLEEAIDTLPDERRDLAATVLRPLVSPTGTKIAWRAADIAFWAKRPTTEIEPILEQLSRGDRRILRATTPPPTQADQSPRYEIFHDVLAQPILDWCAAREAEREREEIARAVHRREHERREAAREQRRERRARVVRRVALVLAALTIGLVGAVYVALDAREVAGSRGLAASATAQLPVDPERGLLLAIEAVRERDTAEAKQALRRSLAASRVRARLGSGPCTACSALATPGWRGAGSFTAQLAIAPDGRSVAGIVGGALKLWRPQTGATFEPAVDVGTLYGVAFTPDARRLLVVGDERAVVMAPDGTHAVALPKREYVEGATSPDSRYVATVGIDGAAVWDARSGRPLARLAGAYYSAAFARAGQIVLQHADGRIVRWHWRARRTTQIAASGDSSATARFFTRYSGSGAFAVDPAADGKVRVVGASGAEMLLPPGSPADRVKGAYISPNGARVLSIRDSAIELWSSRRAWKAPPRRVAELPHSEGVNGAAFSGDGSLVGTASTDGTARVWESATGDLVAELRGHTAAVEWLAFSSSGRFVTTVAEDLTVRLWDLGDEITVRLPKAINEVVVADATGSRIAVLEDGGALKFLDTGRGVRVRGSTPASKDSAPARSPGTPPAGDSGAFSAEDLHPTSAALAAGARSLLVGYSTPDSGGGRAALVDPASGRVRTAIDRDGAVDHVAISPDASLAAIVRELPEDSNARVELWELRRAGEARLRGRLQIGDEEKPTDVAFSRDGRRLLVTTLYGGAFIFDAVSLEKLRTLARGSAARPGSESFYRAASSPDGTTVAVAGSLDVRLWNSRTGEERPFRLSGHTSLLRSIAYSRDGRRIVTASADGTTRVWDARTGTTLGVLSRHAGRVNTAAFLPNGSIVSGGEDRAVRVYPCATCQPVDRLLELARTHVTRELSRHERAEFVD